VIPRAYDPSSILLTDWVNILVNNAGGTFFARFVDVSEKVEAALIAENFTQVTRLVRGVLPLMTDGGAIVNLTSIEAHHAAPGFAVYGAMKAALAQLTRTLALEWATVAFASTRSPSTPSRPRAIAGSVPRC
jgi:NAD(P)-dependent dehydrogenase (short-subunit alcohol dehydrogenase family)